MSSPNLIFAAKAKKKQLQEKIRELIKNEYFLFYH
jgi:uncharacterized protein (DUF1697 family)